MKKILFCLPLLLLALQSCEIEDEYMYDKGLYTIDWDAAADSSSVTLIDRFWNTEENYFNYGNDGSIKDFHYWPQAHAMDVMIDAYNRTGDSKYSDLFDKWYVGIKAKNGGSYWNNFYDDMEWIALTMIRLYEVTDENKYLETSQEMWNEIKTGWNDYVLDVKADIGLTDDDLAGQYQYTKDIVTVDGSQRGTTWQATPGLFAYRRSIAKDVLGTDDPAEVQTYLSDWDKFNDVAAQAAAKGYKMLSGFDDAYRTFSNNVAAPWVTGTTVTVDENIMKWVDQTKEYTDKGYNNKSSLWDSQWAADQGPTGKVFGFFYSTWGINFTLLGNSLETPVAEGGKEEVGNGIYGDYAVCEGPQPYYWGGTWICGAAGSDNIETIKDVMQKLTCDEAIMKQITMDTQDYTNNEKAMEEIAGSDYKSDFLGGQNHIALFAEAAKKIDMSNAGPYDQGLNESFQNAFKDYFTGNVDEDTAKANFETAIKEKYPELTDVVWPA